MLIFDNILFATFIPQILMFLGVVYCFSFSFLSSFHSDRNPEITFQENSIAYTAQEIPSDHVYHFSDYFSVEQAEPPADNSNLLVFRASEKQIFHDSTPSVLLSLLKFAQFSRPPPAFI